MPKSNLFFDSSALIAGIVSSKGAARTLLLLAEDGRIYITISKQVVAEVERNIARKAPKALALTRELILRANIRIVPDPQIEEVQQCLDWISHSADVSILVAAVRARVYFFTTLDTRHFIDDPEVTRRSGLKIGTPGDALSWIRIVEDNPRKSLVKEL
jgi:predicted nucleic acid-binding protein